MKFAVFAVIASLCLLAVSAKVDNEFMEVDEQKFVYDIVKGVLRTLKGINCTLKGVAQTGNAAQAFINDIDNCGQQASQQVLDIVNSCQDIVTSSDTIIHYKKKLCVTTKKDGTTVQDGPAECGHKMIDAISDLIDDAKNTVSMIRTAPEIISEATGCIVTALLTLENAFISLPSWIKECSKLKSR